MTDGGQRAATDKACPVVLLSPQGKCEILAFCHPLKHFAFDLNRKGIPKARFV